MQRLRDYSRIIAWQTGIGYLLLWAVAIWTLGEGVDVFGKSGVCYPDEARVLFYWVCETSSPLALLASVANGALTVTVWAPVYLAAATVQPAAVPLRPSSSCCISSDCRSAFSCLRACSRCCSS